MRDKQMILSEIRRIAANNDGKPPGVDRFRTETGIGEHEWRGTFWARWGDAVREAGFAPLEWTTGSSAEEILEELAKLVRQYGKYPTNSEILLSKKKNEKIPTPKALVRKLGPKAEAIRRLINYCRCGDTNSDVFEILARLDAGKNSEERADERMTGAGKLKPSGHVYLVKSGKLYKIGCSENHWRRKSELHKKTAEGITEVHTISAIDDASGIERYWHERFEEKRQHGEWFDLSPEDISAFKKRKFM